MGAKLSKKKKGYCLGAGKDGESTETTEVEQKETENQEGQKDAAEPKGEKSPTDQSQNNGINEESKDKSEAEVTTGETTKDQADQSDQDQKPEIKPSTEQEKDQPQGTKEHNAVKSTALEQLCEKEIKRASEDKTKTECQVKETPSAAADKPTQESKPVKEKEGSDCQPSSEAKPLAPLPEEVWVKQVSEPVTKVEAEQTEKPPVGSEVQAPEKVPAQANEPVVEPEKLEKVPEKPSAPKSVSIEPVAEQVSEAVVSEPVSKTEVVEPEVVEPVLVSEVVKPEETAVPEKVTSALPNSDPPTDPTHSALPEPAEPATKEPELVPEPSAVPEPVAFALPAAVPEILIEMAASEQNEEPEPVPCPASEKISETEQELDSEPLPPKSTEVPETANLPEPTEKQESLGCSDQSAEMAPIPSPTEAPSINRPPEDSEKPAASEAPVILQNGPSENLAEDDHTEVPPVSAEVPPVSVPPVSAEVPHVSAEVPPIEVPPISAELKAEDNKEQKESEEQVVVDKPATPQEGQVVNEDCKAPTDGLVTSKNENDSTAAPDTKETHDATPHRDFEDKAENHEISAEETKKEAEPPAPEKYGVGNGLPIKEEIKVHLEDKCDKDLHDMNGRSESHEIEVCDK